MGTAESRKRCTGAILVLVVIELFPTRRDRRLGTCHRWQSQPTGIAWPPCVLLYFSTRITILCSSLGPMKSMVWPSRQGMSAGSTSWPGNAYCVWMTVRLLDVASEEPRLWRSRNTSGVLHWLLPLGNSTCSVLLRTPHAALSSSTALCTEYLGALRVASPGWPPPLPCHRQVNK